MYWRGRPRPARLVSRSGSQRSDPRAGHTKVVVELRGERGPHDGIVAGDEAEPPLLGELLQLADWLGRLGRVDTDGAPDRQLVLDVLGEVGGIEGEDEAASPHRVVELDDEALVPRGVPCGQHRRYP